MIKVQHSLVKIGSATFGTYKKEDYDKITVALNKFSDGLSSVGITLMYTLDEFSSGFITYDVTNFPDVELFSDILKAYLASQGIYRQR